MGVLATLLVIAAAVVPPFGGIAALVWARWSGTPLAALGLVRPASWAWAIVGGVVLGVALKLFTKAILLPALGAPATNPTYQQVVGNVPLLLQLVVVSIVYGAIFEEIFWRGFLFERLGTLWGTAFLPTIATVVITALAFAGAHFADQRLPGMEQALVTGLSFGALYAATGSLVPVMVAHAAYDLVAAAIIYLDLETTIAHLFFK